MLIQMIVLIMAEPLLKRTNLRVISEPCHQLNDILLEHLESKILYYASSCSFTVFLAKLGIGSQRLQRLAQLRLVPDVAHGLHRVFHGAGEWRAGVDRRDGLAKLAQAGLLPLLVDQLLQAAAPPRVQPRLGGAKLLCAAQVRVQAGRLPRPSGAH